jgi:hypothetical protein
VADAHRVGGGGGVAVSLEDRGVDEFADSGVCVACAGEDGVEGGGGEGDVEEGCAADVAVNVEYILAYFLVEQ